MAIAPDNARGSAFGVFGLGTALTDAYGVVLLSSVVLALGTVGWVALAAVLAALGLLVGPTIRRAWEANSPDSPTGVPASPRPGGDRAAEPVIE